MSKYVTIFADSDGSDYGVFWDDAAGKFEVEWVGDSEPRGIAAYEQLAGDEQEELFQMLVDEAGDMSSRDIARDMLDGMPLSEMREYLDYEPEVF